MEPLLSNLVRENFRNGLSARDAEQLAFLIFCILDHLPPELRKHQWDRDKIASEFVALKTVGLIRDANPAHGESNYWNAVIDRFLLNPKEVDRNFGSRLPTYPR
ncbi:hypothetical protein [Nibricoccus aquaticus]|uniref:hypothetical protein n=1 Tax=Nibricoccus aquaticus TaxID=2576891 RepID=UPI0010FE2F64|nr:hypothetical protein [Nibricoccus aquaticus]